MEGSKLPKFVEGIPPTAIFVLSLKHMKEKTLAVEQTFAQKCAPSQHESMKLLIYSELHKALRL